MERKRRYNEKGRQSSNKDKKPKMKPLLSNRQVKILERKLQRRKNKQELSGLLKDMSDRRLPDEKASELAAVTVLSKGRKAMRRAKRSEKAEEERKRKEIEEQKAMQEEEAERAKRQYASLGLGQSGVVGEYCDAASVGELLKSVAPKEEEVMHGAEETDESHAMHESDSHDDEDGDFEDEEEEEDDDDGDDHDDDVEMAEELARLEEAEATQHAAAAAAAAVAGGAGSDPAHASYGEALAKAWNAGEDKTGVAAADDGDGDDKRGDDGKDKDQSATAATQAKNASKQKKHKQERKSRAAASIPGLTREVVMVKRKASIEEARAKLPVVGEEQEIMEAINENSVVVVCGPTGSGKTTQVPQFLYEAGYNQGFGGQKHLIGVTEPRRIAAISVAARVAEELKLSPRHVSYQVRYDNTVTAQTKVKFMTDGVLQKEIEQDFALRKYSVIVIDEAHERSMHTDIIIGLLSRIIPLRLRMYRETLRLHGAQSDKVVVPLKLVIMSATLRVEDFTQNTMLFPNIRVPVLEVDARQYKVTTHFSKRTRVDRDPVSSVTKAVARMHRRLPPGGILVFMTGQGEILQTCRKLREMFPASLAKKGKGKKDQATGALKNKRQQKEANPGDVQVKEEEDISTEEEAAQQQQKQEEEDEKKEDHKQEGAKDEQIARTEDEIEVEGDDTDIDASDDEHDDYEEEEIDMRETEDHGDPDYSIDKLAGKPTVRPFTQLAEDEPLYVLPLFSNLSKKAQAKVFQPPPPGHRLCVVATNVAETSITIPNMTYVLDTGLVKKAKYDPVTGATSFKVEWTSKAAAKQRAGRAGRTGPGHCYRLFSSAVFNDYFREHSEPEICKLPADGLILQMKAMGIDKVVNFPFPTPPSRSSLKIGEDGLRYLNALDKSGFITNIGRAISGFPVAPRYGKMLALAKHYSCLELAVAIVAALTVKNLLALEDAEDTADATGEDGDDKEAPPPVVKVPSSQWKTIGRQKGMDFAAILAVLGACDFEIKSDHDLEDFCLRMRVRHKAIMETRKLRQQLLSLGELTSIDASENTDTDIDRTKSLQPLPLPSDDTLTQLRQITLAAFPDHVARREETASANRVAAYRCSAVKDLVYIHPTSSLYGTNHDFIVYHYLFESNGRHYMKDVTLITRPWVPKLAPVCCTFSKPLDDPAPRYDKKLDDMRCYVTATYGPHDWPLPVQEVSFPESPERYKHFAKALLGGDVLETLKQFTPKLLNRPAIMCKSWTKERVTRLLKALMDHRTSTKAQLLAAFAKDGTFLLPEYAAWLPSEEHDLLKLIWPPKQ